MDSNGGAWISSIHEERCIGASDNRRDSKSPTVRCAGSSPAPAQLINTLWITNPRRQASRSGLRLGSISPGGEAGTGAHEARSNGVEMYARSTHPASADLFEDFVMGEGANDHCTTSMTQMSPRSSRQTKYKYEPSVANRCSRPLRPDRSVSCLSTRVPLSTAQRSDRAAKSGPTGSTSRMKKICCPSSDHRDVRWPVVSSSGLVLLRCMSQIRGGTCPSDGNASHSPSGDQWGQLTLFASTSLVGDPPSADTVQIVTPPILVDPKTIERPSGLQAGL